MPLQRTKRTLGTIPAGTVVRRKAPGSGVPQPPAVRAWTAGFPDGGVYGPLSEVERVITDAPLDPDSAAKVSYMIGANLTPYYGGIAGVNAYQYNTPVYMVDSSVPQRTIGFRDQQAKGYVPGSLYTGQHFMRVRVPDDAEPAPGSDGQITIVERLADGSYDIVELWRAQYDASGTGNNQNGVRVKGVTADAADAGNRALAYNDTFPGWSAVWGGRTNTLQIPGGWFPDGMGSSASGLTTSAFSVSVAEAQAGEIKHAVSLCLVYPRHYSVVSWPAQRSDGSDTNTLAIAEGQRLRLNPSFDVDAATNLSPFAKMVAKAAQKYGFMVTDKAGAVTVNCEGDDAYEKLNGVNRWDAIFAGQPTYLVMRNFPWSQLQALPMNFGKDSPPVEPIAETPTSVDLAYIPTVAGRTDIGPTMSLAGSGWVRNNNSSAGTTVTLSGDVPSSHFIVGDRSIFLETNGAGGTAIANRSNMSSTFDITPGSKIVRMLVYVENAAELANVNVRFSNDAYGASSSVSKDLDYRFWHEGWNTVTFNGAEYYQQDTPDLSAMRYVTVAIRDKNAGTPARAWFNAIWSEPAIAAASKGAVVFSFDDGYASGHDVVLPILNKYGMKGTAYVMPGMFPQGNTYLTETKAMNLASAGWTLAAHAWSNAQHVAQTGATLQANFDQTKAWLTNHGITRHHMAYWDGLSQNNPDVLRMIKANFITGRNNLGAGVSLETLRMGQPWGYRGWLNGATGVGNTGTYPGTEDYNTAARSIKNTVIKSKGLIVFTWHNVGSDLSAATFETFAKFCADAREAGDLDVLTIDEASIRAGL